MMHLSLQFQYQWLPFDIQATGSNYLIESEGKFALEGCCFPFYYYRRQIGMTADTATAAASILFRVIFLG